MRQSGQRPFVILYVIMTLSHFIKFETEFETEQFLYFHLQVPLQAIFYYSDKNSTSSNNQLISYKKEIKKQL